MSSTQNSQNLLVNVLRPVYTYSSETGFTAGVVATNLKAVNTDAITAGVAQLGDTGGNIYLGSNAGSTTVGTNSNNVAFGVGAASGINGVQNSVFIGASAGQGISNASNDVVIGAGTSVVGSRNIVIGNNDLVTGSNNFVIASDTILTGSYKVNIGNLIQGDISAKTLSFTTGTDISGGGYFGGNVGIRYPNPTHSLDVSGSIYATSNIILSDGSQNRPSLTFASDASAGIFRDTSGNVGFARGGVYSMKLDPSGSILYTNLTVEGTLACATFDAGGIAATNLAVPGYIRNNDLTFNMDMSQGNLAFTGTGQSRVGNVFISNARLTASNGITGTNFDLSSGNLVLSNNVIAGGFFSNTATNTSNYLGGVYLVDNEVRPSRLLEKGTGAFDLCSNGLSLIGKITGGDDTQSNRIGGIILSNSNAIVPGFIRNALTPTTLNISGGNISNSANTTSSNFTTITASSNNIGGVVLNATNVSNVGTLGTTNALVSGYLRDALTPSGLDISGGNISNSSTTTSSNFTTPTASSNSIGGVVLNASNVSNISTLTSTNSIVSGYLRNALTPSTLDISGGNIAYSGAISNSVINQSNTIGGVTLSNGFMRSGAGTVNAPGVSFLTDTSMGLYRVGTQALGISVGGVNRMTICGDKIGIGTSAPSTMLDISASSGGIKVGSSGTGSLTIGTAGVASEYANLTMNGYFTLNKVATTNEPMVTFPSDPNVATGGFIFMSNKVGIGNATPAYVLDISAGNTANTMRVQATSYPSVLLSTPTSAGSGQLLFDGVGSKYIVRASSVPLVFENPGNTERMRIGTDGRVGIGNPNPQKLLDISSGTSGEGINITAPNASVVLRPQGSANTMELYSATGGQGLYTSSNFLQLSTNSLTGNNGLCINGNKVGIANANPQYLLDICSGSANGMLYLLTTVGGTGGANGAFVYSSNMTGGTINSYITGKNSSTNNNGGIRYTHVADASVSNYVAITGSGASGLNVRQDGWVGINTTTPTNALTVSGNIQLGTAPDNYRQFVVGGGNSYGFIYGAFAKYADGIHMGYNFYNNNTTNVIPNTGQGTSRLSFGAGFFAFYTGNVNTEPTTLGLYQNYLGRVGINTGDPQTMLDINMPTGGNGVRVYGGNYPDLILGNGGLKYCQMLYDIPGSKMIFRANDTSAFTFEYPANTELMRIASNGNVGIGTSAPAYKLDVNGTIRGSSNVVAVFTTSNAGGSYAGATDTDIMTFTYTPKQSGSPRIIIQVYFEAYYPGSGGSENASVKLTDNANTELALWYVTVDTNNSVGRSSRGGGTITYHTTVSGATTFKLRYNESGDDTLYVSRIYIVVKEISLV